MISRHKNTQRKHNVGSIRGIGYLKLLTTTVHKNDDGVVTYVINNEQRSSVFMGGSDKICMYNRCTYVLLQLYSLLDTQHSQCKINIQKTYTHKNISSFVIISQLSSS